MNAITHILGDGNGCVLCGELIPLDEAKRKTWRTGDRIGLITSKWANPVSYIVGDNDCNLPCRPLSRDDGGAGHEEGGVVYNAIYGIEEEE